MLLALAGVSSAAMAQQKTCRCGTGRHYSGTGQVPSNHKSILEQLVLFYRRRCIGDVWR